MQKNKILVSEINLRIKEVSPSFLSALLGVKENQSLFFFPLQLISSSFAYGTAELSSGETLGQPKCCVLVTATSEKENDTVSGEWENQETFNILCNADIPGSFGINKQA